MDTGQHANLREAADLLGVAVVTLRRRIKSNALPEAELEEGDHGEEWRIPRAALATIAEREGWTLDLTGESAQIHTDTTIDLALPRELLERLLNAERTAGEATTRADAAERALRQTTGDLEHERAERQRLEATLRDTTAQLAAANQAQAVADARADEIGKLADRLAADLDTKQTHTARIESELADTQAQAAELTNQLAEADAARAAVEASLGWRARRRLAKQQRN